MENSIGGFIIDFVQIIYFNKQIIDNEVGEIKALPNLHKHNNIKHVILGTIYVYKSNENIFSYSKMQSKSWSLCLLAVSTRREYCEFSIAVICWCNLQNISTNGHLQCLLALTEFVNSIVVRRSVVVCKKLTVMSN